MKKARKVRIEPAWDVGGSLKQYAKGSVSLQKAREKAWKRVVRDKAKAKPFVDT
ncbi:MAG: hypothetical protein ACPW60_12240 [Methylohalobius sp. ZOD2]